MRLALGKESEHGAQEVDEQAGGHEGVQGAARERQQKNEIDRWERPESEEGKEALAEIGTRRGSRMLG